MSHSTEPTAGNIDQKVEHVVILIHGIRSRGAWHQKVEQAMGSETVRIVAPKYGWFPAFRFLAFWDSSKGPKERVCREFFNVKKMFPNAKISVIAHSFGTHIFSKILQENLLQEYSDIRIWRVVLCGSVMKQNFPWHKVVNQIGDGKDPDKAKYIVNDCGNRDALPALAESAGWYYGNAGTDGFGCAYVHDRFHEGGHGLFFDHDFIKEYWQSFITEGNGIPGEDDQGIHIPRYVRCIQQMHLNILIPLFFLVLLAISGYFTYAWWNSSERTPVDFPTFMSRYNKAVKRIEEANDPASLEKIIDNFQEKIATWECVVIKKVPEREEYYLGKDDGTNQFIANFSDTGRFEETIDEGETVVIEGLIKLINQSSIVLNDCRFMKTEDRTESHATTK